MTFYKNFRKYLTRRTFQWCFCFCSSEFGLRHKLTWLTAKLSFLNALVLWLERVLTTGSGGKTFLLAIGVAVLGILLLPSPSAGRKSLRCKAKDHLCGITVLALIIGTYFADKATRVKQVNSSVTPFSQRH